MSEPMQLSLPPTTPLMQQLLPIIALQNSGNKNKNGTNLKQLLLFDAASKVVPFVCSFVGSVVRNKLRQRTDNLYDIMKNPGAASKKGSILIERSMDADGDSAANDMFDAVLSLASDLPQARFIKRMPNGIFIVETPDEIALGDNVMFRRVMFGVNSDNKPPKLIIEVFSYEKNIVQLRDYLTDIEKKYTTLRNNQLGRNIYYFDEFVRSPMMTLQGPDLSKSPPHLTFTQYPLMTNKSLSNVYGSSLEKVKKRINFFVNNRSWYEQKGVPYTMGILMHGCAGGGKTSTIKSIAKDTNRHIINVKLSEFTTATQLSNLFYSGKVHVLKEGTNVTYDIPIDKVIIVMEDIDCLTNVVLDRTLKKKKKPSKQLDVFENAGAAVVIDDIIKMGIPKTVEEQQKYIERLDQLKDLKQMYASKKAFEKKVEENKTKMDDSQKLTLSHILNILDGILETPGRIFIMTSNYPKKLDKALIRPGRIDSIVHFTKCTKEDIIEMIEKICDVSLGNDILFPDYVWSPAKVTQVIFENIESLSTIIDTLQNPTSIDMNDDSSHNSGDEESDDDFEQILPDQAPVNKENPDDSTQKKASGNILRAFESGNYASAFT